LLYDKGKLSLDSKICDILHEFLPKCEIDKRWYDVTIEMALRHRLGLPCGFLDIDAINPLIFTENYLHYTFKQTLEYDPDKDEKYSDGAFYLLACVVEKLSGMSLENFLWKELLFHMDVKEVAWSHCPMGHCMGGTGLYISTDDFVKLGALYLNKGFYKNKQLISENWINLSVEKSLGFDQSDKKDFCIKGGMYGQKLFISFKQNRAVAVGAFDEGDDYFVEFMKNFD
jgi:CubicO group peptidase (beta-lactamase class C family)